MEHPKKNDGMDEAFTPMSDALVWIGCAVLAGVLLLFSAAMWALRPRMIYATAFAALVFCLTVIWAVSTANGM